MFNSYLTRSASLMPYSVKRILRKTGAQRVYRLLLKAKDPIVVIQSPVGSFRWRIDHLTSQSFLRGTFEPYMVEAFKRYLKPNDVVYDVGSYAGYHSLICCVLGAKVFAFEPHERNRLSVETQFLENNFSATVLPYALSDRDAELRFGNHSSGSPSRFRVDSAGEELIECRAIDSLNLPKPNLIKIDVEGHEASVLRGALNTLRTHQPILLVDYHDHNTLAEVRDLLEPIGYEVFEGPPVTCLPLSQGADDKGTDTVPDKLAS